MPIPITPVSATIIHNFPDNFEPFSANQSVSWSANNGGVVSSASGNSTNLIVPNKSQSITLTAIAGGDSGTAIATVYGQIPIQPHLGYEVTMDNRTLVSYAEDGTAVFRRKGPIRRSWQLAYRNTPQADMMLFRNFWNWHQKDIPFYYIDIILPENILGVETSTNRLVTFDSQLKVVVQGVDRFELSAVVREL